MTRMNGNHNHNRPAVARNLFSRLISGHCRVSWEEYLPCKISYVVHIVGKPSCRDRSDIKSQLKVSCTIVQYSTLISHAGLRSNAPQPSALGTRRLLVSHRPNHLGPRLQLTSLSGFASPKDDLRSLSAPLDRASPRGRYSVFFLCRSPKVPTGGGAWTAHYYSFPSPPKEGAPSARVQSSESPTVSP